MSTTTLVKVTIEGSEYELEDRTTGVVRAFHAWPHG
jgi:hypothetical protein